MTTLFCVRPATRNIGNDVINTATADLLYRTFGSAAGIVNIPAIRGPQYGGLSARQIFDMNRLADGVVVGGGNLFENGQLTFDSQAVAALTTPMMIIGVSHGRIYGPGGRWVDRTDSLAPNAIRQLAGKSGVTMVRDHASQEMLQEMGIKDVRLGGCPTLFMSPNPDGWKHDDRVILSVRHPTRMSVPPALQWRVADDVRRLIAALKTAYGNSVVLACHDYVDIEFAAGFPEAPLVYFDDVNQYIDTLRRCRLNVTYRLHAFLPCLAFGTPSIHLSYDERGKDMVSTSGMGEWDVDLSRENDVVSAVIARAQNPHRYHELRSAAKAKIADLHRVTMDGLSEFAGQVQAHIVARGVH